MNVLNNTTKIARVFCDGASRGNPGRAAIGVVIYLPDREPSLFENQNEKKIEISQIIPNTTNNVAEYTGLLRGLEKCLELNLKNVEFYLDSELVVRQILKIYKVKDSNLRLLYEEIEILLKKFTSFKIIHIPREKNKEADALANAALNKTI